MIALLTQQIIKENNLKRLYLLINKHKDISRARLAKMSNLSKPTVSALVDELIATGYVLDCGVGESTKIGRKPNTLMVKSQENFVAVFSWRRSYVIAALLNTNGEITYSHNFPLEGRDGYVSITSRVLLENIVPAAKGGRILGLCVVVPSMIDSRNGKIISTVLEIGDNEDVIGHLRATIDGYPITILNDTACYGYAEAAHNSLDQKVFAFINISKGVGAVLLDHGHIFREANGMTTQFGHVSVDRDGILCSCGNRGCLESMVGELALERRAKECGATDIFPENTFLFAELGRLAAGGNEKALHLMELLAQDLAFGMSNLITLLNPGLIVIGGTGTGLGEPFLDMLTGNLSHMGFPRFVDQVKLRYTTLDRSSELLGASRYYIEKYFSFGESLKNRLFIG